MLSASLIHDHAMALATAILEIVSPCLREEERKDAFGMFYDASKAALTHYEEKSDRMQRRVKPSNN